MKLCWKQAALLAAALLPAGCALIHSHPVPAPVAVVPPPAPPPEPTYPAPVDTHKFVLSDPNEDVVGAVQISLDISDRKRGEEQRQLLVNELNHRVKNTLAVVQAIAAQTMRNARSLAASRSNGSFQRGSRAP